MLIGDQSIFAIESNIARAYARLSFRAWGNFRLHIGGNVYGVNAPEAAMLARSFDAVRTPLAERGNHTSVFSTEADAGKISDAFQEALYAPKEPKQRFFGIIEAEFSKVFLANNLIWAPDGSEAFDDGSYVLQFDVGDRVRLVAFKSTRSVESDAIEYQHDPDTLKDVWLEADGYYEVLDGWLRAFEAEWAGLTKISEAEDGGDQSG